MPWSNPYQYRGYRSNMLPTFLTRDDENDPIVYGTQEYQDRANTFLGQLEAGSTSDEGKAAWDEFIGYITNAMIPYMSGGTASETARRLGSGEQGDPWYSQSEGDVQTWDDNPLGTSGRQHDRMFESSDRWDAINQGFSEAMKYLFGGQDYRAGTGDDPWTKSINWFSEGIGRGQETGLRGNQNYRTRSQEARRQQQYNQQMAGAGDAEDRLENLFENLWGYDAKTGPISRQGYSGTNIYRYSPAGSGQSGFYSYGNSRYR